MTEPRLKCDYCGKVLMVQDELGKNADGNRMVLEANGSQKRACKNCADKLQNLPSTAS